MMDLAQRADLASHGVVAGGVVEELERALLALDLVAHAVDLREAALAEDVEDLEAAVDHVADRVVRGRAPTDDFTSSGSGSGSTSLSLVVSQRLAAARSPRAGDAARDSSQ